MLFLLVLCGVDPRGLADAADAAEILRIVGERRYTDRFSELDATRNGVLSEADAEYFLLLSCDGTAQNTEPERSFTGLLKERYLSAFSVNGIKKTGLFVPSRYKSNSVSVSVDRHSVKTPDGRTAVYFLADIYIRDIRSFRTWYSEKKFGRSEYVSDVAKKVGAVIAMSGDFFSERERGLCIRNGYVLRDSFDRRRDTCVLYSDGTMETYLAGEVRIADIESREPWQAWSFGPALLDKNGKAKSSFNTNVARKNPRAALGYYEPGHYCFVVVDGRQHDYSYGMSMQELSALFEDLGCVSAYNMDGGATAVLANGYGELNRREDTSRQCSDIIYIIDE